MGHKYPAERSEIRVEEGENILSPTKTPILNLMALSRAELETKNINPSDSVELEDRMQQIFHSRIRTPQFPTPPKYWDVVAVYRGVSPVMTPLGKDSRSVRVTGGVVRHPPWQLPSREAFTPAFFPSPQKCDWCHSHFFSPRPSCEMRLPHVDPDFPIHITAREI
jgi:hypothetical protein